MNRTILVMTLMLTAGQMAIVGRTVSQPQEAEYYGHCDVEGCTAAAIHAHNERICLPGLDHYNGGRSSDNDNVSPDNSVDPGNNNGGAGNYENYNVPADNGNYGGHHSQHHGGHHY